MTRQFFLHTLARRYGDAIAVASDQQQWTFREFNCQVELLSNQLAHFGIGENARIAIFAENSIRYLTLLSALWRLAAVAVPISTRWPVKLIQQALERMNCNTVFSDRTLEMAEPIQIVSLNEFHGDPSLVPTPGFSARKSCTVLFTSGSTGLPKAVMHTLESHLYNARGANRNIPLGPGDRWLLSLPLYHIGGMAIFFRTLSSGAASVVPNPLQTLKWNLAHLAVTHVSLVATQLYRLLQDDDYASLCLLKAILLGGSAIPETLFTRCLQEKFPIFRSYGCTEMASQVTTTRADDPPLKLLTSGKPLPYREISISKDGEILVRGKPLFSGYIHGTRVDSAVDDAGWFHTGDLGSIDADGYLMVIGRRDNMFVSGGENIHPEEIEAALLQHDQVENAVVVPIPDPEFGHRPVAFLKSSADINSDLKFGEFLKTLLPKFKIPIAFFDMPQEIGDSPKPSRTKLQEMALARLGR